MLATPLPANEIFPLPRISIISHWLEGLPAPIHAIDAALWIANALAAAFVAFALRTRTRGVLTVLLLTLFHPAILASAPNDARALLLASTAGMFGLGLWNFESKHSAFLRIAAGAFFVFSFIAHAPTGAMFAAAPAGAFFISLQLSEKYRNKTLQFIKFASVYCFIFLWVWVRSMSVAHVSAPGLAIAPGTLAPDLSVFPSGPAAIALGTGILLFSVISRLGRERDESIVAGLFISFLCCYPIFSNERDFLYERGPVPLAGGAALLLIMLIDMLLQKFSERVRWAASILLILLFATVGIIRFNFVKDTDRYLDAAVQIAPDSRVLQESRGHLLMARSSNGEVSTEERDRLRNEAAKAFEAAAKAVGLNANFKNLVFAANAALATSKREKFDRYIHAALAAATTPREKGEICILSARPFELDNELAKAKEILTKCSAQFPNSENLQLYLLKTTISDAFSTLAQARARKDTKLAADTIQQLEALVPRIAPYRAHPDYVSRALVLEGRILLANERLVDATRNFNDAKRLDATNADAYMGAAEVFLSQGIIDGAANELREGVVATQPSPPIELFVRLAAVELQRGAEPDQVLQLLESARAAGPKSLLLQKTIAAAQTVSAEKKLEKGDLAGAEQLLQLALKDAPEVARVHATFGKLREQQKKIDEAILSYQKAFDLDGNSENREKLAASLKTSAIAHLYAKDRTGAVERFVKLRSLHSTTVDLGAGADILADEARAAHDAGVELLKKHDAAGARAQFNKSLEYLPENFYSLYQLATLCAEAAEIDPSIGYFERALEAAKKAKIPLSETALHFNLAQQYRLNGNSKKAVEILKDYLSLGPGPHTVRCQTLLDVIIELQK